MTADSGRPPAALEAYFEALDDGEFERAAQQFTRDAVYVHPPTYSDETRMEGRDELLEYFTEVRGENDIVHHLERVAVDGDACSTVGYVTDGEGEKPVEYFVAFAEFDDDRISYYIAGLVGIGEMEA